MAKFATKFVSTLAPLKDQASVVGLCGDLGSGKTTFVKGVAVALGITEHVTSPTFVIEKIYKLPGGKFEHLIHIDAYRLESGKELLQLGWRELLANPKNLVFLEWPERVSDALPVSIRKLQFSFVDETTRSVKEEKM